MLDVLCRYILLQEVITGERVCAQPYESLSADMDEAVTNFLSGYS